MCVCVNACACVQLTDGAICLQKKKLFAVFWPDMMFKVPRRVWDDLLVNTGLRHKYLLATGEKDVHLTTNVQPCRGICMKTKFVDYRIAKASVVWQLAVVYNV